ncbi:hypothetical protein SKAU_G00135410 [Synaphobranchus kaupii]|uniref:Uncharacterized protein n=1 Tax=Synaphobranchus kaupii TaxID=118154 RepID=A0A9Q1FRZ7_SYNKA|nr:hypothetical protein SKAU_G00135410 [Synaphobranchus kaupii]
MCPSFLHKLQALPFLQSLATWPSSLHRLHTICASQSLARCPYLRHLLQKVEDDRIAAIIGESAVVGVYVEGDTDLLTAADSEDEEPLQRKTAPSRPVSQTAAAASVDTPAQEESSRPSPSSTSGYRSQARVLSDAVLQSQRDLVQSVNEVVAELRQLRQTLVQMNQTLVDCLNKRCV